MDTDRRVQSSHPFRPYSVEDPVRPYACQANPTSSPSKSGDHSNSTSRSVFPSCSYVLVKSLAQHDSVHTIQDALAHVSQAQLMQIGQSSSSRVSQQVHIEVLPSMLVLRLKRLLYDTTKDGIIKISKSIQFAPELEIPPGTILSFVFPGQPRLRVLRGSIDPEITAPVAEKSAKPAHYKLYGVLYHHGDSGGCGHYTVDVLHSTGDGSNGEGWLHIDDEAVSVVQREEMFGSHDNERGKDRCAYMLFYCRTAASTHDDFAS